MSFIMIKIEDKKNCVGCGACYDACAHKAITFTTDNEGFDYPKVDEVVCVNCGLCEKVCPILHLDELKANSYELPDVYSAYINDLPTRIQSTSGGLFSAFANNSYKKGGYVSGAVYEENYTIKHILSNNSEDLCRIRGSKHAQSQLLGIFTQVKKKLLVNEQVLFCAAPCQIAGLHSFLGKEYENLITIDFLCLGINSPKIFAKYLKSLEEKFGGKIVTVQAKNKDLGWRSLAYKVTFNNGKVYLKKGLDDVFTRGFIKTHCNSRPACYDCKFKGYPRVSDISLGDFWGIERVNKEMDDNKGTSVVLINSKKGAALFEEVKEFLTWKSQSIYDVLPGNLALLKSIALPSIDREQYYKDLDQLSFDDFSNKYYPKKEKTNLGKAIKPLKNLLSHCGLNPFNYINLLAINFLRRNSVNASFLQKRMLIPTSYSIMHFSKNAKLHLKGTLLFGAKRIKGSHLESRLCVEGNGELIIGTGGSSIAYGTDILVFNGAKLTLEGSVNINQKVQIICMDDIYIGKDVMISRDVVIRDNDGGHEIVSKGYKKTAPVRIGNHVWIGQGAIIMKGVTIGDGAIIGAGAFVATNVKPRSLVMADPSRTVQKNIDWIR